MIRDTRVYINYFLFSDDYLFIHQVLISISIYHNIQKDTVRFIDFWRT